MDHTTEPALLHLLDSARSAEAARSRSSFGALREHQAEDATVVGLLADLLERRTLITIATRLGHERRGVIELVGDRGLVLTAPSGRRTILRLDAVASIRSLEAHRLDGAGRATTAMSWPSMVARFIDVGDDIHVIFGASSVIGRVRSLSRSLIALETAGGNSHYAVLDAIDELSLNVPGSIRQD